MNYSQKREAILNALFERHGLQYLVNVSANVLNNPIFIMDLSGKFLAKSQRPEDLETWESLFPDDHLIFSSMLMVEQAGIYKRLLENDEPVLGLFDFFPKRFLGCRIRDKGSAVGIATIIENNEFQQDDSDLIIIICKSILFEMLYHERTSMQTTPYFSLFKDLMEHAIEKEEALVRCQTLRLKPPKFMHLIALSYSKSVNSLSLHFTRETILASLPFCYCIMYREALLVIIDDAFCTKVTLETIKQCFHGTDILISISRKFGSILELSDAYEQIKAIQNVHAKLNLEKDIIFYEDILLYHFFETASQDHNLQSFCHPVIEKLKEYDEKNGTFLMQSVEAYLECGRSIQKAAKHINIHKNTLYYRLRRAEELFTFDLEDENVCFLLQFSFRMQRMLQRKSEYLV